MIIPIRTDYRMRRRPWVNYALIVANVALYILGYHGGNPHSWTLLLHPAAPQLYQFFTSMFLHAGLIHLLGNMVFLWVFGNAINDRLGHIGYLAFYLGGGVLAGVGYVLLAGTAPVLGASGAISAVTGAYLVLLPRTHVTVMALLLYIFVPFEISSLYFLAFQFIWNLVASFTTVGGIATDTVAYVAHASGYVYGIGVAAGLLAARLLKRDEYDLLHLLRDAHRRSRYRRMVAQGYDPFRYNPRGQSAPEARWIDAQATGKPRSDTASARELQLRRDISEHFSRGDFRSAADTYIRLLQLDDKAVLPRQQQLDVANHLMAEDHFEAAAAAYETFVRHYGSYEYIADIYLMLGILSGRYLERYDRAEEYLLKAIDGLHDARKIELARADLAKVRAQKG